MEIDSEKFDGNEKNVSNELKTVDENIKKCEIVEKNQEDMVANTQDSAETKVETLTIAATGADADTAAGESTEDGGSIALEIVTKVTDSEGCDNNKDVDRCEDEKSTEVLNSSTEDVGKETDDLLVPMDEYAEQEVEEIEEEECEKSSPVKGGEAELISDTDEFNEEDDGVDEIDEDDYDDSSSDLASESRTNRNKSVSDEEDDDSDADDYNDEDDDDDDVELVPDSSDEDDGRHSQDVPDQNQDIPLSDEDDDDEDYDDDDLMNDVIMSSSKKLDTKKPEKRKDSKADVPRKRQHVSFKKKLQWDHRVQLKKRSLRWLIKKIQKDPMTGGQYGCRPRPVASLKFTSTSSSTPIKSSESSGVEVISIDLDDSPEKSESSATPTTSQIKVPSSSVKQPVFTMQQVDKIRDCVQNAEDLKQQQHVKALKDDQNKENVENNDKLLRSSLKLNGNVSNSKNEDSKAKENDEKSDKTEVMDITTTEDEDKTLEATVIKGSQEDKNNEEEEGTEEKGESEESVKDIMQIEVKHSNQEEDDDIVNEAVLPNEASGCKGTEKTQSSKINYKNSQVTDLKKSSSTKRSRSASLDDSVKQDDIHPTKKLRAELESNFPTHDRILSEYIEKTSNNSVDEIQKHINQLIIEIQTLNDMIKTKEIEWNNMLHLKKVKEEICFRLSRKKQMMEIMSTKVGEANLGSGDDSINDSVLQNASGKPTKLIASTPNVSAVTATFNSSILNNLSNAANAIPGSGGGGGVSGMTSNNTSGSTAQSILQNRANMKSSDLAREKANTQRLHRNILPKPSSSSSAAVAGFGGSPQVSIPTISSTTTSATTAAAPTSATGQMGHIPLSLSSGTGQLGLTANGSLSSQQPILNSYLTAAATVQQQLGEMLNGHHNSSLNQLNNTNGGQTLMVGRQGVFKDVKSIIADYRQRHPEVVPRRGRRVKSNPSATDSNSILSNVLKNDGKLSSTDLGALLTKFDGNSRPSSNDSSHSMTNLIGTNTNSTNLGHVSFKDVLVQFAKMSGQTDRLGTAVGGKLLGNTTTTAGSGSQSAPPPYPEVTLHPVSTSQSNVDQTGSLLHGILTKYTRPNVSSAPSIAPTSTSQSTTSQNFSSTFSPTLARLLTAPERISSGHNTQTTSNSYQANLQAVQSAVAGSGLNLSKVVGHNSEITITPVISSQPLQQTLLQQQLQQQQQHLKDAIRDRVKGENLLNLKDAEADDSVDRLVIDEGGDSAGIDEHHRIAPHAIGQEFHENEVPACQGCKKQEAQFVCAGCGNQWYCSRECQVAAWDEHSEVCTG